MEENIPWTKPIRFGRDGNILILARRKSFARREIPLYLPQTLVGAIFTDMSAVANENKGERLKLGSVIPAADTSIPLIAENIIHNWIEVNYKGDLIHHIPILTTPRMDSRKYKYNKEWDHYISVLENYTYDYDSRAWFRQDADIVLLLVNQILERNVKVLGTQDGIFWKLLLISKAVSKESFKRLIIRLNDLMI